MPGDMVSQAIEAAHAIGHAHGGRRFAAAVGQFAETLASVPDYTPADVPSGTIPLLKALAEDVIVQIERRIDAGRDRAVVQRDLAESVYDVRRGLEEIDRWQRHYLGAG